LISSPGSGWAARGDHGLHRFHGDLLG